MPTQALEWVLTNVDGHLTEAEARVLYRLTGGTVVEVGSFHGRSTCVLGLGALAHGGHVYAIDAHLGYTDRGVSFGPADSGVKLRNIVAAQVADVVRIIHLTSAQAVKAWESPVDLLFIDADHSEQACRYDFNHWSRYVIQGGYVAFHDASRESVAAVIREARVAGWVEIGVTDNLTVLRKPYA